MARYALIRPDGSVDRVQTDKEIDPTVKTKAGWKWVPVEDAVAVEFDVATEVSAFAQEVKGGKLVETFVVRPMTDEEKTADFDRALARTNAMRREVALPAVSVEDYAAFLQAK